MSVDKLSKQDWDNMSDQEWDKKIDALASKRQVGGDHYKKLAIQPAEYCFKIN